MAQIKPPETVLEYIRYLGEIYADLRRAYVFGSYAKGSAGTESDIDIAVISDRVADSFDFQVQLILYGNTIASVNKTMFYYSIGQS